MENAKILVVEDESILAMGIKSKLEKLGHTVVGLASTGIESIEKTAETCPDLILMDIVLKGNMDGIEAAQEIMNQFDTPIIYLTAYADEEIIKRAMITEPYAYLLKPFKESELNANIQMALYKHKIYKEKREALKKKILADFYDFVLSSVPTSSSENNEEMKDILLNAFSERLEKNMKPKFEESMENYSLDMNFDDPENVFGAYVSWLVKIFSELGIKTNLTSKDSRIYLEFLNCPWIHEARKNPVFCLNCQSIMKCSLNWTDLNGDVGKTSSIADGSKVCVFKFYIPTLSD